MHETVEIRVYWVGNEWNKKDQEKAKTIREITEAERIESLKMAEGEKERRWGTQEAVFEWAVWAEEKIAHQTKRWAIEEKKGKGLSDWIGDQKDQRTEDKEIAS